MTINLHTCVSITCCRCGDGWEEGTPHLDTLNEAIEHARSYGFTIVGDTALCGDCALTRDCETTGHQWPDEWHSVERSGVHYRYRYCEHCRATDYDPPWEQLKVLSDAAEVINAADPKGGTP